MAHVIIVSAPVQIIGFWDFLDFMIWGLLGQGIRDLDSGLKIDSVKR